MLAKRVIPCLDVKDGRVVKGVRFQGHRDMGDIMELAGLYNRAGADELVFYDITASSEGRTVATNWIRRVASVLNIPFCVAGGIRTIKDAEAVLSAGADKISINSPALERPALISELARQFGKQCVVVGIDSMSTDAGYEVYQYTGDPEGTHRTSYSSQEWAQKAEQLGAGELVINCMNQDGVRRGYDIEQLQTIRSTTEIPVIASGGAGNCQHFVQAFSEAGVDGCLAAGVFHEGRLTVAEVKQAMRFHHIEARPCE